MSAARRLLLPTRPRALLIDGNSFMYAAFFGTPPLHSPHDGRNVNAVYTTLRAVVNHVSTEEATYAAICWDRPEPTFRHQLMSSYKAQRSPTPDDLKPQFNLAKEAMTAFGVPQFERIGYEADDLIATLTHELHQHHGFDVRVISADKDLLQLVRKGTESGNEEGSSGSGGSGVVDLAPPFNTKKGIRGYDQVIQDWEVEPDQLPALFALIGDAADNVKGVAGIGQKIGSRLLNYHDTLEGILCAAQDENSDDKRKGNARGLKLIRAFVKGMEEGDADESEGEGERDEDGGVSSSSSSSSNPIAAATTTSSRQLFGNTLIQKDAATVSPKEYLHMLESMHRMRIDVRDVFKKTVGTESICLKQLTVSTNETMFQGFLDKHAFHSISPVAAAAAVVVGAGDGDGSDDDGGGAITAITADATNAGGYREQLELAQSVQVDKEEDEILMV